ncbi:uncharacterized protein LOC116851284 isoform X2 [Odontomachus brunneus]|uniref:uncharacterized protein LOC116851284 isoform X2 n=1 Tax=Odontomachus brunneus TaxID=486640 RepID=UPI0013F23D1B|nr:uncharacterized protein LOC116851284 isoform X2 [Odontomachus brunneus]
MDEIRGSPSRRLSQIIDPITRFNTDFGSNSAPCSPRLGTRVHDVGSGAVGSGGQSGPAAGSSVGISGGGGGGGGSAPASSRTGPSGAAVTAAGPSGPDSPRLWPRQFRQAPTPPPRPRHAGVAVTTVIPATGAVASIVTSAANINNNNNNNNVPAGSGGDGGSNLPVHSRDSPYVNVSNLFFQRDKSFAESARSAGYIELRSDKPKCSPYDFTSESSGHVEYADKRTFVPQPDLAAPPAACYEAKDPAGLCRLRSNFDPGPSGRGHFDRAFSFSGRQPEQPAPRIYEAGRLFVDQRPAPGSVDVKREKLDVRPSYATSKSFDGYTTTVEELNWQERCLELQLELHRSRSQATRVRDMLREKICSLNLCSLAK